MNSLAVGGTKLINALDSEGFSPVHVACIHGKLGAVRALMAKGGQATLLSGKTGIDGIGKYMFNLR